MLEESQTFPSTSTLRHSCSWGQRLGKLLSSRETGGRALLAAHPRTCVLLHVRPDCSREHQMEVGGCWFILPASPPPPQFGCATVLIRVGRWGIEGPWETGQLSHRGTCCHPNCPQGPGGCLSPLWAWGHDAGLGTWSTQCSCKLSARSADWIYLSLMVLKIMTIKENRKCHLDSSIATQPIQVPPSLEYLTKHAKVERKMPSIYL